MQRKAIVLAVLAVLTTALLAGCGSAPTVPGADPAKPTTPSSAPLPRPALPTMRQIRHIMRAQDFRAYTGPQPPRVSAIQAVRHASRNIRTRHAVANLGAWDVGLVHDGAHPHVEWHSVWVVASVSYSRDLNLGELGYRGGPRPPRPGWGRGVTMIDTTTGEDWLGASF